MVTDCETQLLYEDFLIKHYYMYVLVRAKHIHSKIYAFNKVKMNFKSPKVTRRKLQFKSYRIFSQELSKRFNGSICYAKLVGVLQEKFKEILLSSCSKNNIAFSWQLFRHFQLWSSKWKSRNCVRYMSRVVTFDLLNVRHRSWSYDLSHREGLTTFIIGTNPRATKAVGTILIFNFDQRKFSL